MKKILTDINIDGKVTANGDSEFTLTNSEDTSVTIQELYDRTADVSDSTVTFTDDSTTFDPSTDNVQSGGLLSTLFQKIKKWFSNLGDLAFINKDGDTSNKYLKGDGTWGNPSSEFTGTIGGLNLVYGSASMHSGSDVYSWRASGGTVSTQSISSDTSRPLSNFNTCIRCTNGGSSATNIGIAQDGHHVSFKAGDKLTQSLWIRVSTAGTYSVAFQPYYSSGSSYSQGGATLNLTTDWTRISLTTNIVGGISGNASVGYFYVHSAPAGFYFEVCGMKVENGDTPTDWSPAPEDIFLKEDGVPEAELVWGGKDFAGDFSPLDAALVSELGPNRMAFAKAAGVTIEYSRDTGSTWTDYGATDAAKLNLTGVLAGSSFVIGKADSTNKATANGAKYQLRITFDTSSCYIYTQLRKFVIYLTTSGSNNSTVDIQLATHAATSTFTTYRSNIPLSGWSGYNVINLDPPITTYGNRDEHYQKLRFIFKANGGNTSYVGMTIYNIFGYGGMGWTVPSAMARTGHLYSYNSDQTATFPYAMKLNGGRVLGLGDDEGLVINNASNNLAAVCLGNPGGKRAVLYHDNSSNKSLWRFNNGSTSYDIEHPAKSGTIAITSDITVKSVWTGTLSAYNSATKTAGTLYLISG